MPNRRGQPTGLPVTAGRFVLDAESLIRICFGAGRVLGTGQDGPDKALTPTILIMAPPAGTCRPGLRSHSSCSPAVPQPLSHAAFLNLAQEMPRTACVDSMLTCENRIRWPRAQTVLARVLPGHQMQGKARLGVVGPGTPITCGNQRHTGGMFTVRPRGPPSRAVVLAGTARLPDSVPHLARPLCCGSS